MDRRTRNRRARTPAHAEPRCQRIGLAHSYALAHHTLGGVACHRTVAGAARWHTRRRGGPHDGACERPAKGARPGDEPGTCPAPADR